MDIFLCLSSNNSAAPFVDLMERNMKKASVMALELLVQLQKFTVRGTKQVVSFSGLGSCNIL